MSWSEWAALVVQAKVKSFVQKVRWHRLVLRFLDSLCCLVAVGMGLYTNEWEYLGLYVATALTAHWLGHDDAAEGHEAWNERTALVARAQAFQEATAIMQRMLEAKKKADHAVMMSKMVAPSRGN